MLKIRRSPDRIIFNMGTPIIEKDSLYITTGPCTCSNHDGVAKWKRFLHYRPLVWQITAEKEPVMRTLWCFSDVTLNRMLNKQRCCRWLETPWRSCDVTFTYRLWRNIQLMKKQQQKNKQTTVFRALYQQRLICIVTWVYNLIRCFPSDVIIHPCHKSYAGLLIYDSKRDFWYIHKVYSMVRK